MGKSIRSKIKRKHRSIKRDKYHAKVVDQLKKNGTSLDPILQKHYAAAWMKDADRVEAHKEALDSQMEAEAQAGPGPKDAGPMAAAMLRTAQALGRGRRGGNKSMEGDESEIPSWDLMSQNQRNKLVKATRLKKFSKQKRNRRNIQTKEGQRRLTKRGPR